MDASVAAAVAWAVLLGGVGGVLTEIGAWYKALRKPRWQPPDWLFGPAWTVILGLAAWAAVLAYRGATDESGRQIVMMLFGFNFVFHLAWSPLFFKLRRPDLALIEVVFLWGSVLALVIGLRSYSELASWLVVPYLIWVSFAAILNLAIVRLNPRTAPE